MNKWQLLSPLYRRNRSLLSTPRSKVLTEILFELPPCFNKIHIHPLFAKTGLVPDLAPSVPP